MQKLLWGVMVLMVWGPMANATAQEGKATKSAQPAEGEEVVVASQVLERESKQGAQCEELVLDLDTAHVALLTVKWQHAGQDNTYEAVLPWCSSIPDEELDSDFWKNLSRVPPEGIDRAFASTVYTSAREKIYWSDKLADAAAAANFDTEKYKLTTFTKLKGQVVNDKSGASLGKIVDLGVNDSTGEIVYCVLESSDSKFRAIPLGAFMSSEGADVWTIDLDREQVLAFESHDLAKAPQSVARGWQEYVAVKYGRNGLQQAAAPE